MSDSDISNSGANVFAAPEGSVTSVGSATTLLLDVEAANT